MLKKILDTGDNVMIPKPIYEEMLEDIAFLRALEMAGVDNWEGYSQAQEYIDE